jgi:RimJ/RimL family protein N-acetyltransferase
MFAISLGDDGAELRPLEPWQAPELLAHMDRGREFVGRYIALPDFVADLDSTRAYLRTYAEKAANDTGRLYGIWADGRLVGGVLFRTMDLAGGTAEAGCWLEPAAAGRGLVTRAARVIIDWAVEERGIHRVEWLAASENEASIAVARRLGMTRDGVLRESYLYRGKRHDMEDVPRCTAPAAVRRLFRPRARPG